MLSSWFDFNKSSWLSCYLTCLNLFFCVTLSLYWYCYKSVAFFERTLSHLFYWLVLLTLYLVGERSGKGILRLTITILNRTNTRIFFLWILKFIYYLLFINRISWLNIFLCKNELFIVTISCVTRNFNL